MTALGRWLLVFSIVALPAAAQQPSGPPLGATAQCRDGSYSFSKNRSGTCSHHGGVTQWLPVPIPIENPQASATAFSTTYTASAAWRRTVSSFTR
jgi:hypothetical protein